MLTNLHRKNTGEFIITIFLVMVLFACPLSVYAQVGANGIQRNYVMNVNGDLMAMQE